MEPQTVIEDLDPEPEGAGRSRAREIIVGLVLIFGVVAWALFTSWQEENNRSHYDAGQQAVIEHRWEDALANYSAAKGYKDADARADYAIKQIGGRDRNYELVEAHKQNGPAALVLQAARAIQTIQPAYKDVDQAAAQAKEQVYSDALGGAVVMRPLAHPPGLYYRNSTGWHYLQSSDRWSGVLSIPLNSVGKKYLVYDVPGPGWTAPVPTPTFNPSPYIYRTVEGNPDKAGRRLVMATLPGVVSDDLKFDTLQLDPASYNFYVCGDNGVWGARYDPSTVEPILLKGLFNNVSLTYEEPGQQFLAKGKPVAMPGTDGRVADFGHKGDSLLIAAHGQGPSDKTDSKLYFARGDGTDGRIVFSTTDDLVSAALSPDDRYALVVSAQPIASPSFRYTGDVIVSATLLTLDGSSPPTLLQKISLHGDDSPNVDPILQMVRDRLSISSIFLEEGAFKNRLLLGWSKGTSVEIWLLDPSHPQVPLADTSMDYTQGGVIAVVEQPDTQTLLLYNLAAAPIPATGPTATASLLMLQADAHSGEVTASACNVPLPQAEPGTQGTAYFMSPTLRGDNLVYRVDTHFDMRETYDYNVYSISLSGQAQPARIFGGQWSALQSVKSIGQPLSFPGPSAYTYMDAEGNLHARLYTSTVDVTLEKAEEDRIAFDPYDFSLVLR